MRIVLLLACIAGVFAGVEQSYKPKFVYKQPPVVHNVQKNNYHQGQDYHKQGDHSNQHYDAKSYGGVYRDQRFGGLKGERDEYFKTHYVATHHDVDNEKGEIVYKAHDQQGAKDRYNHGHSSGQGYLHGGNYHNNKQGNNKLAEQKNYENSHYRQDYGKDWLPQSHGHSTSGRDAARSHDKYGHNIDHSNKAYGVQNQYHGAYGDAAYKAKSGVDHKETWSKNSEDYKHDNKLSEKTRNVDYGKQFGHAVDQGYGHVDYDHANKNGQYRHDASSHASGYNGKPGYGHDYSSLYKAGDSNRKQYDANQKWGEQNKHRDLAHNQNGQWYKAKGDQKNELHSVRRKSKSEEKEIFHKDYNQDNSHYDTRAQQGYGRQHADYQAGQQNQWRDYGNSRQHEHQQVVHQPRYKPTYPRW